ncbi:MAG: hypothetical protein AAF204_03955 [Pseudomonadota bacterium]
MLNRSQIHGFLFLSAFALCTALPASHAWADGKVRKLTEANVKKFIEQTTDITLGNSDNLSSEKISEYLDKHIEDKARFKSVMRYHMPNMPVQQAVLNLKKDEFMGSVAEGANSVEGYENLVQIKEIKVASSGKKAFVKTESTEYATMSVPTDTGGSEDVPMEGVSECTQVISLNGGVIQMYSANCVTEIHFLEY